MWCLLVAWLCACHPSQAGNEGKVSNENSVQPQVWSHAKKIKKSDGGNDVGFCKTGRLLGAAFLLLSVVLKEKNFKTHLPTYLQWDDE